MALDDGQWVLFRDVYQVDGTTVANRDDRLAALFMKPTQDSELRAKQILEEGARYNLGPITRTLNTPTQALAFIREENQARSRFRLGAAKTIDSIETRELRFEETASPRMIVTRDHAAAAGRFWVIPESGSILRTELRIRSEGVSAVLTTHYSRHSQLSMWLPSRMTEFYDAQGPQSRGAIGVLEADATYADFRRFSVNSRVIIR